MRLREVAVAVVAAAVGAVGLAGQARALDKVKVTMAANACIYAPYFNAIQQGYFKAQGIEVEIIKAGGGVATPGLISGRIDFSTSSASALSAILKGAPLKVILTAADRPTYQLWSTQPDLTTIQSLKGKQIGIQTRGDTFEIWLRRLLRMNGMSGDDVGYTPLGYGSAARVAAVKTGSLPAVVLSSADVEKMRSLSALSHGHVLADAMKVDIRLPYTGLATSNAMIEKRPDLVQRFVRANLEGLRFMKAFEDKTIDNVMKYNNQNRKATKVDCDDTYPSLTEHGFVSEATQKAGSESRAELIKLPKDKIPPLKDMFDYEFVKKAGAELDKKGWKPSL